MKGKIHKPSSSLVVAVIALFVALSGTAGAVGNAVVPALAKRALVADNAKKLNGLTARQLGGAAATAAVSVALKQSPAGPRPASTASSLVAIKTQSAGQVASGAFATFDVACDAGNVVGGGMASDGAAFAFDSFPKSATTWEIVAGNLGSSAANVSVYATCLK
jgi:hypothetical protein